MTRYEPQQVQHTGVLYAEDHCAIRWPSYFHATVWPLLLAVLIATSAVIGASAWSWLMAVATAGTLLGVGFTIKNWPVGIRIAGDGIRIGGVRLHPRRRKNLPWADYQRRHVLFCPWEAVRRAAVITGKPALRGARPLGKRDTIRLGVLTAPFTRAALLIEVDPDRVVMPQFREPDTERQLWRYSHLSPIEPSPVWYVPTRRPAELRAVLAQHAPSSGGQTDPRLPAYLRLLFERADVTRG